MTSRDRSIITRAAANAAEKDTPESVSRVLQCIALPPKLLSDSGSASESAPSLALLYMSDSSSQLLPAHASKVEVDCGTAAMSGVLGSRDPGVVVKEL